MPDKGQREQAIKELGGALGALIGWIHEIQEERDQLLDCRDHVQATLFADEEEWQGALTVAGGAEHAALVQRCVYLTNCEQDLAELRADRKRKREDYSTSPCS